MQFFDILSYKVSKKKKLPVLKSLAKLLKNKKLQIKNQDKIVTNYVKRIIKKRAKLQPRPRTTKIVILVCCQNANFVKKNTG